MRERIAQRIHNMRPKCYEDFGSDECLCHDQAAGVLDELGWDKARTIRCDDYQIKPDFHISFDFGIGGVWTNDLKPGIYRLIREASE